MIGLMYRTAGRHSDNAGLVLATLPGTLDRVSYVSKHHQLFTCRHGCRSEHSAEERTLQKEVNSYQDAGQLTLLTLANASKPALKPSGTGSVELGLSLMLWFYRGDNQQMGVTLMTMQDQVPA